MAGVEKHGLISKVIHNRLRAVFHFKESNMAEMVRTDLSRGNDQVFKFVWTLTTADPTGDPIDGRYAEYFDRTVYFSGTWGGATVAWEGGDGTTYLAIADGQGTAITRTSDLGMEAVVEAPEFSRPRLSTVGSGATITATCIARRGFRRA